MAARTSRRTIVASLLGLLVVIYYFFIQPLGPASPQTRAPGHLQQGGSHWRVHDDLLVGNAVMPKLGNETAKQELGRATWRLLHTMMARYPEKPTEEEKEILRSFIYLFARLYPCGECASHFQAHIKKYPPQVSSRQAAAGWACFIHNEVNKMLKKPIYDCNKLGDEYDCGCGEDDDDQAADTSAKNDRLSSVNSSGAKGTAQGDGPIEALEISREPPTRGG